MSNGAVLTLGPLRLLARWSLRTADHVGRFSFLIADMFRGLAEWRIWVPRTLEQATAVGYGSLFIVLLVAGFAEPDRHYFSYLIYSSLNRETHASIPKRN